MNVDPNELDYLKLIGENLKEENDVELVVNATQCIEMIS